MPNTEGPWVYGRPMSYWHVAQNNREINEAYRCLELAIWHAKRGKVPSEKSLLRWQEAVKQKPQFQEPR